MAALAVATAPCRRGQGDTSDEIVQETFFSESDDGQATTPQGPPVGDGIAAKPSRPRDAAANPTDRTVASARDLSPATPPPHDRLTALPEEHGDDTASDFGPYLDTLRYSENEDELPPGKPPRNPKVLEAIPSETLPQKNEGGAAPHASSAAADPLAEDDNASEVPLSDDSINALVLDDDEEGHKDHKDHKDVDPPYERHELASQTSLDKEGYWASQESLASVSEETESGDARAAGTAPFNASSSSPLVPSPRERSICEEVAVEARCPHGEACVEFGRCPERFRCPHTLEGCRCPDGCLCEECYRCGHARNCNRPCDLAFHCPHEPECPFRARYPDEPCPYAFWGVKDRPHRYAGRFRRKNTLEVQREQFETFVERTPWNVMKYLALCGPPALEEDDPRRFPDLVYLAERRYPPRRQLDRYQLCKSGSGWALATGEEGWAR